jgi:hypothetical protein
MAKQQQSTYSLIDLPRIFAGINRQLKLLAIRTGSSPISTGLAADRPTPTALSPNTTIMYYATDTNTLSIWNTDTSTWKNQVFT